MTVEPVDHTDCPTCGGTLILPATEMTAWTRRRCLVKGCTNHAHQGRFVGDLCAPCHTMLTTGKRVPSNAWIAETPKLPVDGDTK